MDDDQGVTATIAYSRGGFGRVATAVGRGEAGIVIALEVARLARNSPDWHHLMYVCRWTDTLMADENAVYDLSLPSDRMVLGLRGQMSELEMDLSIHRMVEARWNKARRGEVMTIPPAGYEINDLGNFVRTSDQAVANATALVFSKFDELGSARQVWVWFCEQGLKLPVRRIEPRSHPVLWTEPKYRTVCGILLHPIYAGAYVFGRSQTVRQLDPDDSRTLRVRCVRRPRKQWPVLILDHHDAYISFDKYLENRKRLSANQVMGKGNEASNNLDRGPARRGPALLQGLVRCGRCGRKMLVGYGGDRAGQKGRTMQYRCRGARTITGGEECQLLGGRRIDEVVVQTFLEATEPAGVEATAQADELVRQENEAIERSWQLEVEKAAYEAKRAERQYNAVEPENRIVVRELERRWNEHLSELETVRADAEAAHRRHKPLSEAELARAKQLGDDLEAVWKAETTTNQDRKRLLRCVIDEVQLNTEPTQYQVRIVWKGGEVTERHAVRRRFGGSPTSEDTIELVRIQSWRECPDR